jgi:hypothetical protein
MSWEAPIAVVREREDDRADEEHPAHPEEVAEPMIACGAASGTAVWSTRIIELASVIAASVIFMFRREVILAAAAYVKSGGSPRK